MLGWFSRSPNTTAPSGGALQPLKLLVLQEDDFDWAQIMAKHSLPDGRKIQVYQTSWKDIKVGPVSNVLQPIHQEGPESALQCSSCSNDGGTKGREKKTKTSEKSGVEAQNKQEGREEKEETKGEKGPSATTVSDVGREAEEEEEGEKNEEKFKLTYQVPKTRCHLAVTILKQWKNGKPISSSSESSSNGSTSAQLGRPITITPDFVLVRNEVSTPHESFRHELLGLLYANIPSINHLQTILLFCDKPTVQGALNNAQATFFQGREKDFPLISQDFFPTSTGFFYGQKFPAVVKFGTAHAGYGKLRVAHHHDMDDIRTLLPLTKEGYCTAEPMIDRSIGDLRIQKIGKHLRAFFRLTVSGSWKTNTGSAVLKEIPVTKQFEEWAEAAARMFNPMTTKSSSTLHLDILTVDGIVEVPKPKIFQKGKKDRKEKEKGEGEEEEEDPLEKKVLAAYENPPTDWSEYNLYILEVNGTSSGLSPDAADEDNELLAQLVTERMTQHYMLPH